MSKSTPSLMALLGLVAVAGYQNRGRISEMLSDARQKADASGTGTRGTGTPGTYSSTGGGGFLADIGNAFQASPISAALGDLVDRFRETGRGDAAESWISDAPNMPVNVDELENALGQDTLAELEQKTGLSRAELLLRLNVALPEVVNRFTPHGRLPNEDESRTLA